MMTREARQRQTIECERTRAARNAEARNIERRMRWPHRLYTSHLICQCLILILLLAFILTM